MQSPRINPFRPSHFLLAAHKLDQLPPDEGAEVAFAGRSNAGKSSALNRIADQSGLARTSKTPGRTQQIIMFEVTPGYRLVDLPGYGYAKVPEEVKRQWQITLQRYLEQRTALRGLVLVMDVRHPLTEYDRALLAWCREAEMAVHALLTKADKLKRGPAMTTLTAVRRELPQLCPGATAQLFSAQAGTGVDEVRDRVTEWLGLPMPA